MASILKEAYKIGRETYTAVNDMRKEHSKQKLQGQPAYYGGVQAGQYHPTQIPGQYSANGQQPQPPSLPPRPTAQTPAPQSYGATQGGYTPTQGYHMNGSVATANPPHSQGPYIASNLASAQHVPAASYAQQGHSVPTAAQQPASMVHQISGTIPAVQTTSAPQSSWPSNAAYSTAFTPQPSPSQPLSAWEIAGGARLPQAPAPTTQAYAPVSPPPAAVSPLHATSPYSPPAQSQSPHYPFPHAQTPTHQAHGAQQQYPQQSSTLYHSPTPPMSPPLPSPVLNQAYGQTHQYPPASTAVPHAAFQQHPHPHSNQVLASPSPTTASPVQQRPPPQPSPPLHMQPPVSPTAPFASPMPHPPAFVSELSAEPAKPKPLQPMPVVQHTSASIPEGYAELPAELPSEPLAKPSASPTQTHPESDSQNEKVDVPRPLFSSPKPSQISGPPAAYAPQQYTPAQSTSASPAPLTYQPYHVPAMSENLGQAGPHPTSLQEPPQHDSGYKPYALQAQAPAPYQAMPASGPPQQATDGPQRMGSLASKISSMNLNAQHAQYAPYPGA